MLAAILMALPASSQALSSLLIPTDAKSLAMGGTTVLPGKAAGDAQALFGIWAPASASNTIVGADAFISIGDRLKLSLAGKDFMDKPYNISGEQGTVKGTFKPYDLILSLGVSYFITEAIDAGMTIRSVTSILAENAKGSAFCGDVRVGYSAKSWNANLSVRNLGTPINYGNGANNLPTLVAVHGGVVPVSGLSINAEADYLFSGAMMAGAGVGYCYADIVSVRAGFHYGDPSKALPSFGSIGLGGKIFGIHLKSVSVNIAPHLINARRGKIMRSG